MQKTLLKRTRVLDAGKILADNKIVKSTKLNGEIAYEKIDFFQSHKRKILQLLDSPEKLKRYATKRNVRLQSQTIQVTFPIDQVQALQITIDDIQSFKKAWRIKSLKMLGDELSESAYKNGLINIIGEGGLFKDWGGETNDIYTTRLESRADDCLQPSH